METMEPVFSTKGDAMAPGTFGNRFKYIHAVGATSKVSFKSFGGHPYTGIFRGAD